MGSVSNDFNVKGVKDNCILLDSAKQAQRFHHQMLNAFIKSSLPKESKTQVYPPTPNQIKIVIVGAGATGVELSAELVNAQGILHSYGFEDLLETNQHSQNSSKLNKRSRVKITLIEASPRILPPLPERIARKAALELQERGVEILTNHHVKQVTSKGVITAQKGLIEADLRVWAAGVQAPPQLRINDSLQQQLVMNRIGQIEVNNTLLCKGQKNVFAMGDCAACQWKIDKKTKRQIFVPPRAQAAHQQAATMSSNIKNLIQGDDEMNLKEYKYRDYGSLVSLTESSAVGSLMGNLRTNRVFVEGRMARFMYISLYRNHQVAIHGWIKTALMLLIEKLNRVIRPRLKLH